MTEIMDFYTKSECRDTIERIDKLLSCGIFNPENSGHILLFSAYTELMINLRDLLYKVEKYASRIDNVEDVIVNGYVKDLTDAVTAHRDACCHIDSYKRRFELQGGVGVFNRIIGRGNGIEINGIRLSSDYTDDIAYFMGSQRLYFKRQIVFAYNEGARRLAPFLKDTF